MTPAGPGQLLWQLRMWSPQAGGGTHCVAPYIASLADPRSRRHGQCLSHLFGPFSCIPLRTEGGRVTGVSPLASHRAVHCHWSVYFVGVEVVRPVEGPLGGRPPLKLSLVPSLEFRGSPLVHSTFLCAACTHVHFPKSGCHFLREAFPGPLTPCLGSP